MRGYLTRYLTRCPTGGTSAKNPPTLRDETKYVLFGVGRILFYLPNTVNPSWVGPVGGLV